MSGLEGLRLAVAQSNAGVTGDQHSPWARASSTPGAMLAVGSKWSDSVGQTATAWRNVNATVSHRDPVTGQTVERPPTKGETAARVLRAAQGTIGGIMGGLGLAKDALDVGFASLTAPLAAIAPSLPAATVMSPYLGTPHAHPAHPPSGPPPIPPTPCPSLGMTTLGPTPRVLINSMPAARCDDIGLAPTCMGLPPAWFKIKTGSSNVFIGGSRAARLGDICVACKNIPDPPTIPAGKVMAAIGKAAGVASTAMQVAGIAAGALGIAADVAEAAVEDDASMAAAKALAAAMGAVQMALDQAKQAVEKTIWKDPTLPPTGSMGAIIDPSHATVLIGGFPMINIPDPVGAVLNRLKRYKARAPAANGGCGKEGEPVDVVTGANLEASSDVLLHRGLGLAWCRYYDSSASDVCGPLGYGWRHEFECELRINFDGIEYVPGAGSPTFFPPLSAGGLETFRDGWKLRRVNASTYQLSREATPGREFVVGVDGRVGCLTRVFTDRAEIKFVYDQHACLVKIVGGTRGTITIEYDACGLLSQLSELTDSAPPTTILAYEYDAYRNLVGWTDALGHAATLDYDDQHRLVRKGDRRGYSYLYTYDERGRCIHTRGEDGLYDVRFTYLAEARCTQATHGDGGVWTYFYDENGTITRIVDPYGRQRERMVDSDGKILFEVDPAGNQYKMVYDAAGGIIGRQDPFGHIEPNLTDLRRHRHNALTAPSTPLEWEHGTLRRPKDIVPTAAARTFHDVLGRAVEERLDPTSARSWSYDANGNVLAYMDADGSTRHFTYASWNLLRREADPLGHITQYDYTARERVTRVIDPGGSASVYAYDLRDNVARVIRHGRVREEYVRDPADNLIEKRDGAGRSILNIEIGPGNLMVRRRLASGENHRFEYDRLGRLTLAATDLSETRFEYGAAKRATGDMRDGFGVHHYRFGRMRSGVKVLDRFEVAYSRASADTTIVTDPTGREHRVVSKRNDTIVLVSANGTTETRLYDGNGRCLEKSRARSGIWPPWVREYAYSPEGDLVSVRDSLAGGSSYEYDAAHRLIGEVRSDGSTVRYRYDPAGNLLTQPGLSRVVIGTGNRLAAANGDAFAYNDRDHIASRRSAGETISFEYDSCDRLARCGRPDGDWSAAYDPLGRRVAKTWQGRTVEYYWDSNRLMAERDAEGAIRLYVYLDPDALTPFMFVDYSSIDSELPDGDSYHIATNHIGAPIQIEDAQGRTVWRAALSPYGHAELHPDNEIAFALRWPGHYEDSELGLFYNRFRYYSPTLGRYIQSDPMGLVGGINLYSYSSNPLASVDLFGLTHPPKSEAEEGDESSATGQNEEKANKGKPAGTGPTPVDDEEMWRQVFLATNSRQLTEGAIDPTTGQPVIGKSSGDPVPPVIVPHLPEENLVPGGGDPRGRCGMPRAVQGVADANGGELPPGPIRVTNGGFRKRPDGSFFYRAPCENCAHISESHPQIQPSSLPPGVPEGIPPGTDVPFTPPAEWTKP